MSNNEILNNDSEEIVRLFLEAKGWTVADHKLNASGFDIVAMKNGSYKIIEVKKVGMVNNKYWRVRKVSARAEHADLIAMVFPDNFIYFQDMQEHLKLCSDNDGDRYITSLVDIYGDL